MTEITLDDLPLGEIPRFNDPLGEFHCVRSDPRYAGWNEPTNHWTFRGSNWRVGQDEGGRFVEQMHESRFNNTILTTGAIARRVAAVEVEVHCPGVSQEAGLVFAFRTAMDYLCLHLDRQGLKLSRRADLDCFIVLGEVVRTDLAGRWLKLAVRRQGRRLACLLDGQEAFSVPWPEAIDGEIGLLANCPARFRRLAAEGLAPRPHVKRRVGRYPRMRLVRKVSTEGFGGHRQIRFGDLSGEGRLDLVVAQRAFLSEGEGRYSHATLGCLTAMDNRGKILWQVGPPNAGEQPRMSGDLNFQINDIDGDGKNEVVTVRGFEFQVLDGATGKVKFAAPAPDFPPLDPLLGPGISYFGTSPNPYPRLLVNCLRFADLAGRGAAREVLVKDAHHHLWALSAEFKVLWTFCGNIGHFPFAGDINADGREEVVAGYHTLSPEGKLLETVHFGDHADAVFAGDVQNWGQAKVIRAGGDDGLSISGLKGDLLIVHHGHVQRLSVGNFRKDAPGLEYALCTFWGAPGIVALLDGTGKVLWSRAYPVCGNTLQPVNWTGDGEELIFFSAHADLGGLYDWHGRQVVPFPDDGHPELCSEVIDLYGGGRDNLLAWDEHSLWIYEPTGELPSSGRRYCPRRPPLHSFSNFMTYYSIPPGT
jgi:rhamnogalacturonan endolyase